LENSNPTRHLVELWMIESQIALAALLTERQEYPPCSLSTSATPSQFRSDADLPLNAGADPLPRNRGSARGDQ
jgi:hypothetical protein